MPTLQRGANGGVRKNAGDLTPELAARIIAAVRKTPLSLRASAYACGYQVADLKYLIKRGSLPGADPLWEDTSCQVRALIAAAEARNFRRLEAAATGGTFKEVKTELGTDTVTETVKLIPANVSAQAEIQRQVEKDTWGVDPQPEDAPIVYDALFSDPESLPSEMQDALRLNAATLVRWLNACVNPSLSSEPAGQLESSATDASDS